MKSLSVRARCIVVCLAWALVLAAAFPVSAQTNYYATNGVEYPIAGQWVGDQMFQLAGDQMFPDVAVSPTSGFVVWQDNATDGDGWGISAQRLDSTFSGTLSPFRVNVIGAGDQERPHVAMLKNGGAAFVWQGGQHGSQHIYARFLTANNTFVNANDLLVNTYTNNFQINPVLAVLTNGNVVVVWTSYAQVNSNSMLDVYGQILSTNGTPVGANFLINQFTDFNQRNPAVAPLNNGGFIVSWVSEQERIVAPNLGANTTFTNATGITVPSVDIYARLFGSTGTPVGAEFLVNTGTNVCANPAVAVASDGSYLLAWSEKNVSNPTNGWDIYARPFTSAGVGGAAELVNTYVYGDQYIPRIQCIGLDYLVAWTSLGEDGSREGVFAQYLHSNGAPIGHQFQVNTTVVGSQMQPAIAADGVSQFLAVWTSFTGVQYGFDLFAQRYANVADVLQPMSAPFVWAPFMVVSNVYQPQLVVTWAPVLGLSVASYEVYVDGAATPSAVVTSNSWIMTAANGLTNSSTHSFAVDYLTTDSRRSPVSPSASGTTWAGGNYYGIPFEWMEAYYGYSFTSWPANVNAPLTPGGLSLYQVFMSGGDPLDPSTWLRTSIVKTDQGVFLTWNSQPGATYQVLVSTDFKTWSNSGNPRFAAGNSDSINVGGGTARYYRIVLLR